MAIVKVNKRLGPFDISGGVSRGDFKSSAYHKTDRDPRFKQQSNNENTVGRFRAAMNAAEGYARLNRFAVRIFPPLNLDVLTSQAGTSIMREGEVLTPEDTASNVFYDDENGGQKSSKFLNDLSQTYGRQVNIHCNSVSMPPVTLDSQSVQRGSEPPRDQVQGHNYEGEINATFYADKYMRERHFFEAWQKMAVDPVSHKVGYYDNYIGKMQIYQLGAEQAEDSRDRPTYAIEATEVYPKTISAIEYNYGTTNEIVKISVGFAYKQWYNMATDPTSGRISSDIPFGTPRQREAAVKARNQGLFGFLPPVLQRVGKDVINQGRTVFNPTGRIFGGKVFPPFT